MVSVNKRAAQIARRMVADADALGVAATQLPNGTTVVDAGVAVPGSLEAGRLFAEACLGGLGDVRFAGLDFDGLWLPGVTVSVSHPPVACMAAQYAGWALKAQTEQGKFSAMGSGPARALFRGEPLFEHLDYEDQADVAVLALEGRELPPEEAAEKVGFAIGGVISGFGTCPLAPIAKDDLRTIGRTNDGVLYGGRAWYTVQANGDASMNDASIEEMIERLPSSASRDYGTPFYELFQRYNGDFYEIDPLLFSPAEVSINSVTSGRTFHAGQVNGAMLRRALLA
jgi:methenyltetrahydromethanopterin cyclohydrolase